MIFFMNKPDEKMLERLRVIGGDEEKVLVLAGDGVFLATPFWQDRLTSLDVEEIYAVKDDVEARNAELSEDCRAVSYDKLVDLLFSGEQVVSL
ncbi:MAG: DsrH/TusB family sulfur metabolism protein [Desulfocurvibacter africanus]